RRRVNSSLGLGLGHALHSMAATLVLQIAIDTLTFKSERDLFKTAQFGGAHVEDFDLPAAAFAIVAIHGIEIAGEQGRFIAAGAAADFHHAATAIGILAADGHVEQFVPKLL